MRARTPELSAGGRVAIGAEADEPGPPDEQAVGAVTPPISPNGFTRRLSEALTALARRRDTAVTWSHTRPALRLGTALVAASGAVAVGALLAVGFAGVGTHIPPWYQPYTASSNTDSSGLIGPQPPLDTSIFQPLPPAQGGPLPDGLALSLGLSADVLQVDDLPDGFTRLEAGPTGSDPTTAVLASYHAVYQLPAPAVAVDGTVAVISIAGLYSSVESASFHLHDLQVNELGAEAGLPGSTAEPIDVGTVGDESRAAHLITTMAGVNVGVYLVQFRVGAVEGIVGVAAPLTRESLPRALLLAQAQVNRIRAGATPQG